MNVKGLSLLLPALMVAGSASAAEIYNKNGSKLDLFGKVTGLHYFSSNKEEDGDQSSVRFGFKGEQQINSELTGYGQWEFQVQANEPETAKQSKGLTRIGFAGLKFANLGSLDYGRNYGAVYEVTSWTDVLPEFGGDAVGADNFLQSRANGLLTYRNTDFFGLHEGLKFALQYQGKNGSTKESNNGRKVLSQNGEGFSGAVSYDIGQGFSIGTAFSHANRTASQRRLSFDKGRTATTYTGALKYQANDIYLAVQYTQTYNATRFGTVETDKIAGFAGKAQNLELVAQYSFDFGLRPSLAYLQSKGQKLGQGYGKQYLLKYVDVGATYEFNKNLSTYVDYKINLLNSNEFTKKAGINTDNIVALGVTYQF